MANLLADPLSWNEYPGGPVPGASWNGTFWEVGGPGISAQMLLQQLVTANEPEVDVVAGVFFIDDEGFDAENPKKLIYESGGGATFPVFITSNPFTYEFSFPAFEIEDPLVPRLLVGYDTEGVYPASVYGTMRITPGGAAPPDQLVVYNCVCDDADPTVEHQTLAELRTRMMVRGGFAASANNPPPGKLAEIDDYLQSAQRFLYKKVANFQQSRYYRWPLVQGQRFYDLDGNDDECTKVMSAQQMEWVGISRGGGFTDEFQIEPDGEEWQALINGIPPEFYSGGIQQSWPTHYEVRQCIELWPAPGPDAGYLRIKGKFGMLPLVAPTDRTTIDSELVFTLALAMMRRDAGKLGANDYTAMVQSMIGDLNAGSHHPNRRNIPGTELSTTPPRPVMRGGWIAND